MTQKASGSAIIERGSGIVLVSEHVHGELTYALPGGQREDDENIYGCIVREAREESGLIVAIRGIVGVYEDIRTARGNHLEQWVAATDVIDGTLRPGKQQKSAGTYSDDEIRRLGRRGKLKSASTLTALEQYRDGVLFDISILNIAASAAHTRKSKKSKITK